MSATDHLKKSFFGMSKNPHPRKPSRKNKPVVKIAVAKQPGIDKVVWKKRKVSGASKLYITALGINKVVPQATKNHFGGNSKTGTVTWFTPKPLINLIGPFDLDPCSHITRPYPIARRHYTIQDNGLVKKWKGLVFCNPPYDDIATWLALCAAHKRAIALVFNRTETDWFFDEVWAKAYAVNFVYKRIKFCGADGKAAPAGPGAGSVLIAYDLQTALRIIKVPGKFIDLKNIFKK